jgi:hypothetical protein
MNDCPNCEYHKQRAARWRAEAYKLGGNDGLELPWTGLTLDEIGLLEELYAPPVHPDFVNDASHCLELIRHVEYKLKEKNT